jgi:hypothetical protein
MSKTLIVFFLVAVSIFIIISGCNRQPNITARGDLNAIEESYSRPECVSTPFNNGNAQIITATSTYNIAEVDIYLQNWVGASITGTARMEIQNTAIGSDYLGNTLDIPNNVVITNGFSNNVFDTSKMSDSGCTRVSFYFSGCPITIGSKYALVIYWNGLLYNMGINDDLNDITAPLYNDFVNYGNSYWVASPRIAYTVYGN